VFVLAIWYDTLGPIKQKSLENKFHTYSFFIFSWIIAILDLTYPVILTYDSGHYLWLADLLRTNQLQLWDPIRNVGYPLYLRLGQILLGYNQMSALIPIIINHIILYVFACLIIFEFFDFSQRQKTFVKIIVFLFIALDPTIFGYYHVLLTEQLAATLAIISCYVAINLYKSEPFSRTFYISLIYFSISIIVAWHIKQPYLGAALFPFFISGILTITKHRNKRILSTVVITGLASIGLLWALNAYWNRTLIQSGNILREDRQLSTWAVQSTTSQLDIIKSSPMDYLNRIKDYYLVASNFYIMSRQGTGDVIREPSFTRGFENEVIAHRIFKLEDNSNLFYAPPYAEYMAYLKSPANPPYWLERAHEARLDMSDFLFTFSYSLLPIAMLLLIVIQCKRSSSRTAYLIILAGTAFLNSFVHSTFATLDRYFFFGYPLLLCLLMIIVIMLLSAVKKTIQKQKPQA